MPEIRKVTVFGYSLAKEKDQVFKEAFEVCRALAENGYTIVNGGGPGVMRASSLGAKAGGGKVIGVTFYPDESEIYEGRDPINPIDREIKTDNYVQRTLKLLEVGDVYLVFRGGAGTISELGMAWEIGHLYFGHHKPVLLYGKFWRNIVEVLRDEMLLVPAELKVIKIVTTPEEVINELDKVRQNIEKVKHTHKDKDEAVFQL